MEFENIVEIFLENIENKNRLIPYKCFHDIAMCLNKEVVLYDANIDNVKLEKQKTICDQIKRIFFEMDSTNYEEIKRLAQELLQINS